MRSAQTCQSFGGETIPSYWKQVWLASLARSRGMKPSSSTGRSPVEMTWSTIRSTPAKSNAGSPPSGQVSTWTSSWKIACARTRRTPSSSCARRSAVSNSSATGLPFSSLLSHSWDSRSEPTISQTRCSAPVVVAASTDTVTGSTTSSVAAAVTTAEGGPGCRSGDGEAWIR